MGPAEQGSALEGLEAAREAGATLSVCKRTGTEMDSRLLDGPAMGVEKR